MAWISLERPLDLGADPTAVKPTLLRNHDFTVQPAALHQRRIESKPTGNGCKGLGRRGIPPDGAMHASTACIHIEIFRHAFPFTETATGGRTEQSLVDPLRGEVVSGGMKGLENPLATRSVKEHLTSDANQHVIGTGLKPWWPGIVSNPFRNHPVNALCIDDGCGSRVVE